MMSMKRKLHVFHIEKPQAISLQLHYKSRDLSLFILLPEDVSGLDQVRGRLWREDGASVDPCVIWPPYSLILRQLTYIEPLALDLHVIISALQNLVRLVSLPLRKVK